MHFTGKERDSESGNDNFKARYYGSGMGRFMTPDPAGNFVADLTNPQSWNMYAYVMNNPLRYTDPTGLDHCDGAPADNPFDCATANGTWVLGNEPGILPDINSIIASEDWSALPGAQTGSPTSGGLFSQQGSPQSPGKQNIFTCAAGVGDKLSIAGGLHALGIGTSGVGGFITDALGGNAFSGATNLIASLGSGAAGGHNVFYNMAQGVVSGPGQGVLPPGINGPWGASASGLATDAIAKSAWSSVTGAGQTLTTLGGEASLASTAITAAEFASGVAEAKYAYDALSYATGLFVCAAK